MIDDSISIVLPVMNEEEHIKHFCESLITAFRHVSEEVELIIVDGSTDQTWSILGDLAEKHSFVRPVKQSGKGFSQALGQGLKMVSFKWILAMNADGNHRIEDALELFLARKRGEMIVGSRFVYGGGTESSYIRFLMSRYASKLVGKLSGSRLRDNFSSFFLIEKEKLSNQIIDASFHGLGEGMLRLTALLREKGTPVKEHPVVYGVRLSGSSKTNLIDYLIAYLKEALRIRREKPRPTLKILRIIAQFLPVALLVFMCSRNPDVFVSIAGWSYATPMVFICLLLSISIRIYRFHSIVKGVGWNPGIWRVAEDLFASRYWNEMLPVRLGDLVRVERLNQRDRIPVLHVIGMIYWEKIIGITTAIIGLAVLLYYIFAFNPSTINITLVLALLYIIPIILTWTAFCILYSIIKHLYRISLRGIDMERVGKELTDLRIDLSGKDWQIAFPGKIAAAKVQGVLCDIYRWNCFTSPRRILHTVITSYTVWILVGLSLYFMSSVFNFSVGIPVMLASAFATGITAQIRYLPGGIGQIELTQSAVMGLLGVPLHQAVILASAYSISMRLTNVVLGLLRKTGVFSGRRAASGN